MFRINIVIRTYPDLQEWIEKLPRKLRAVKIRERAEQVLQGEKVEPLPVSHDTRSPVEKRYAYQIIVSKDDSPILFDYCQYIQQHGYDLAPHFRWLLLGQLVPNYYEPFTWEQPSTNPVNISTSTSQRNPVPDEKVRPVQPVFASKPEPSEPVPIKKEVSESIDSKPQTNQDNQQKENHQPVETKENEQNPIRQNSTQQTVPPKETKTSHEPKPSLNRDNIVRDYKGQNTPSSNGQSTQPIQKQQRQQPMNPLAQTIQQQKRQREEQERQQRER